MDRDVGGGGVCVCVCVCVCIHTHTHNEILLNHYKKNEILSFVTTWCPRGY